MRREQRMPPTKHIRIRRNAKNVTNTRNSGEHLKQSRSLIVYRLQEISAPDFLEIDGGRLGYDITHKSQYCSLKASIDI